MSDETHKNGTWKTIAAFLGAIVAAISIVAAPFALGMTYQRGTDQQAQINELKIELRDNYLRRDLAEQHFVNLQQQLNRIERAIVSGP